jgi:ribosome-binding factor A
MPGLVPGIHVLLLNAPESKAWTAGTSPAMTAAIVERMARHKHHRESAAGPSQRALRVGELVRHALADMLARGDVHDPVLEGHLITVPEVRMSPDLRLATIYVVPLGGKDESEVIAALDRNKRYLRGEIAQRVNLKFAPDIRFRIDERFDEAERIAKLLQTPEVKRDLEAAGDKDE